ncbi:MAG: flagellar assembly protein FliX [Alphaproteobacteria bacterium]|nr:flagellar assembly protein FliX [Alphaproteobacteria bacterium]
MKVEGPRGPQGASPGKRNAGVAAPGFAAPAVGGPQRAQGPGAVQATPAIDAVLALQDDGQAGRRARQSRRGSKVLDALERLRIGLLRGRAEGGLESELEALGADRAETGDPALDDALREIDTRAAVELAKLRQSRGRPR